MFEARNKKRQNITAIAAIAIVGAMLVFVPTVGLKQAYAENDANGIQLKQPFSTYTLTYGNQYYEDASCYDEDHGTASDPSSMRMNFIGTCAGMDSVMIAGFFKLSEDSCRTYPAEEIAAELNGGVHHKDPNNPPATDTSTTPEPNENYADTIHPGITIGDPSNLPPQDTRVRLERTHPDYSPTNTFTHNSQSTMPPNNGRDLCETSTGSNYYVGFMAFKVNLDGNCDGQMTYGTTADKVSIIIYVDTTGLSQPGNVPRNNWELAYKREFTGNELTVDVANNLGVKEAFTHWVNTVGEGAFAQQSIRIDNQNQTDWNNDSINGDNAILITMKEVTALKNGCTAPQGGLQAQTFEESTAASSSAATETDSSNNSNNNDNASATTEDNTTAVAAEDKGDNEEESTTNNNSEDNTDNTEEDTSDSNNNNNSEEDKRD